MKVLLKPFCFPSLIYSFPYVIFARTGTFTYNETKHCMQRKVERNSLHERSGSDGIKWNLCTVYQLTSE